MKDSYCVIMAGGIGRRLWPISTTEKPKQFLDILGVGRTLIQQTYDRFSLIFPDEKIMVVTHYSYVSLVMEQLPMLLPENIISEPIRRDTAAAIAYAAHKISKRDPNATMVVTPSDHLIGRESVFVDEINKSIAVAESGNKLVLLGIKPTRPDISFGYVQMAESKDTDKYQNLYGVKTFTEKPNVEMAQIFIDTEEFFWNSGIFVWSVQSIIDSLSRYMPDSHALFSRASQKWTNADVEESTIKKLYSELSNISIDYGVMEKASNVFMFTCSFTWADLGGWNALHETAKEGEDNNAVLGGRVNLCNSSGNFIKLPDNRKAIIHGLTDFIVVESDELLLICNRSDEREIKRLMESEK